MTSLKKKETSQWMPLWKSRNRDEYLWLTLDPFSPTLWIHREPAFCSVMVWRALQHVQAWVSLKFSHSVLAKSLFWYDYRKGKHRSSGIHFLPTSKLQAPGSMLGPMVLPFQLQKSLAGRFPHDSPAFPVSLNRKHCEGAVLWFFQSFCFPPE